MPVRIIAENDLTIGSVFTAAAHAIVIPVNARGTATTRPGVGGVAGEARRSWSEWFRAYKRACEEGRIKPGGFHVYKRGAAERRDGRGVDGYVEPTWILSVATKDDWRRPSRLAWVESGMRALATWATGAQPNSIAVPALGCGLGGLSWHDVRPLAESILGVVPKVDVMLFEPRTGTRA